MEPVQDHRPERTPIKAYDVPALVLFGALILVVSLQFVTRYVLNDSLAWTEELARFLLLGVTFFGAISLIPRGEQIAVEFIYARIHKSNAKILMLAVEALSTAYFGMFAVAGVLLALQTEQFLISIPVPKAMVYVALSAAILICAGFAIQRLLRLFSMSSKEVHSTLVPDAYARGASDD